MDIAFSNSEKIAADFSGLSGKSIAASEARLIAEATAESIRKVALAINTAGGHTQ